MSFLDKVIERRDAVKAEMDAVLEAVASENRTDLTVEETEKVDALVEESRSLDSKIEKFKAQADADVKASEARAAVRWEEHTSEQQSLRHRVCRLLLEKKKHTSLPQTSKLHEPKATSVRSGKQ